MNNLQELITEYALKTDVIFDKAFLYMFILALVTFILFFIFPPRVVVVIFYSILLTGFFVAFKMKSSEDRTIILKENYNIEMKEKDDLIEVKFNKKENNSTNVRDTFKVFLEKTNEDKYYVYFDDNKKDKKDKKEVSLNEIKETFGNIKRVETTKFSLSEINNEERK